MLRACQETLLRQLHVTEASPRVQFVPQLPASYEEYRRLTLSSLVIKSYVYIFLSCSALMKE